MDNPHKNDKNKAPPSRQTDEPILTVATALAGLMRAEHDHAGREMAQQTTRILGDLGQIQSKQQQALYRLEAVQKQVEAFLATNELLEKAGTHNQILTDQHYEDHVIGPMVRSLFPVFDIVHDAVSSGRSAVDGGDDPFLSFAGAIWTQLRQFLLQYGVEIVSHASQARFDPKIMRPVKTQATDQRSLDQLVARCLQVGFRRGQDRMLRLETVSLYAYRPTPTETTISMERKEDDHTRN